MEASNTWGPVGHPSLIWRKRQDSNLHTLADERFSRPRQYQLCLLFQMRVLFFMRIPAHWVTRFLPRAGLDLLFINRPKMLSLALGGEGGIRTLARFYPPNPLAGGPLWPLGYLAKSKYVK